MCGEKMKTKDLNYKKMLLELIDEKIWRETKMFGVMHRGIVNKEIARYEELKKYVEEVL
jgi:NAD(P)H-dependent flavin oxidoreductase YrpB (nitropropane dioxygenase family)